MKLKKLLLLPVLFALTSCGFSAALLSGILGIGNDKNIISFDDSKVEKATAIPKRVKRELKQEVKNVYARSWLSVYEEKPSASDVEKLKTSDFLEGEAFASFDRSYVESRLMKEIDGKYYCLPISIQKDGEEYKFGGALGVYLDWNIEKLKELDPKFKFDKEKYCESIFKSYEQEVFFSDSIVEYLDNCFNPIQDALGSLSGNSTWEYISAIINQVEENFKNGLKVNMYCVENNSKGNFVLDIKDSFDVYRVIKSQSKEFSYSYGESIHACRLTFENYCLSSASVISDLFSEFEISGTKETSRTYLAEYYEYKYNVDADKCFTDSKEVLTEQEARDLLYKE